MKNVMLDIETLGTTPNSVIVSIAAVKFNFGNDEMEEFEINIDVKSSKGFGMLVEKETLEWWATQPKEVRNAWLKDPVHITEALDQFIEFLGPDLKNNVIWCNGMNFDYPVLEWSLKACSKPVPWKYWNLRDARTVYSVFDLNMKEFPRVGDYHNAIDDCKTQIAALKSVLC